MVRMPHWPKNINFRNIDFRLERMLIIMEHLGNPHLKLPPMIHIAGTNGKGSTVAFISNILRKAGYNVHRYTSPHIVRFNERIQVNNHDISDEYLYQILEKVRLVQEKVGYKLTFFEATTAAAIIAFYENEADFLVVETGMGGRLDATNIIENKIATVITPISLDHTEFLGESLAQIASEKAGIMREKVPVIVSQQTEEALQSLINYADKINSELRIFDYEFGLEVSEDKQINFINEKHRFTLAKLSLLGDHQYINAAAAIETILTILPDLSYNIINNGLANSFWPARMQLIKNGKLRKILPKDWNIYVDGAHNAAGGQILGVWAHDQDINMPLYMICGMTKNRDVQLFLQYLAPKITFLVGVFVEDESASYHGYHIASQVKPMGIKCDSCEDLDEALQLIRNFHEKSEWANQNANVLICGSLYLAGMFLRLNGDMIA